MVLGVERTVDRTVAVDILQRAGETVFDRFGVIHAPYLFEVGSRDEDIEQIGESGAVVGRRGPIVEIGFVEARTRAGPVLALCVDGVQPRGGPILQFHAGLGPFDKRAHFGDEVADDARAELPPLFIVGASHAGSVGVVGEYILRETVDAVSEVGFERFARSGREIALSIGEAAIVEGIAVELVFCEQFVCETQHVLLIFGQYGIEERRDFRRVVLDVFPPFGRVFDTGSARQFRVGVGRSLAERGESRRENHRRDGHF